MKRLSFLPLTLLLASTTFAQTNPGDLDTLKALHSEVRLLRQDLRTTTVASGVSSKAANWGQIKTGQRKWPGTVRSCTRS